MEICIQTKKNKSSPKRFILKFLTRANAIYINKKDIFK